MKTRHAQPLVAAAIIAGLTSASLSRAQPAGEALTRISRIGPAIYACWTPPAGAAGRVITLRFSFKRNGEILGKPRITFSRLQGNQDEQQQFVASVLKAVAACTPLKLGAGLGEAIAGRPFTLLFKASTPAQRV